ncbi:MAG: serine/threonine protein phosphatase [Phenylobacterium sp.]|nr:MAG: serine/threonine protein phosphatase [Phenylobacterium sp.]
MPAFFDRLFGRNRAAASPPSTGERLVYAVGDVHGRLDVLAPLIRDIAQDAAETHAAASVSAEPPLLVFLGDYVDRGPESRGVVDLILELRAARRFEVRALKGNHEEALLQFLDDPSFGSTWAEHGGAATLSSYGVQPPAQRTDADAWARAREAFTAALPPAHKFFYETLELMVVEGDYAFVHAGVRPGVALADQLERDLLWIRHDFLEERGRFEKIIVHGHTPLETPQLTPTRLGVDTGAYATGVLTAVRLQGEDQRVMQAKARRGVQAAL